MRAHRLLVLGIGAALWAAPGWAEARVGEGARVRVKLVKGALEGSALEPAERRLLEAACGSHCRSFTGRLLTADQGTLTVRLDGRQDVVTLPPGSLARVEVSRGHESRGTSAAKSAGLGLLTGAVIGGLVGLAWGDPTCQSAPDQLLSCLRFSRGEKAGMGAAGLGALGLVIGGLAGAANPGEDWRAAPELTGHPRVGLGLRPLPGRGVAAAVSVSF
jgi:hypothetical protein